MPTTIPAAVLIVDDKAANLIALEVALRGGGFDIVKANSGAEAIAILAEREFALILLDAQMPGMSGFEVARKITVSSGMALAPIIFLTANDDTEFEFQAYDCGAVDYIQKPFNDNSLRAKVDAFVKLYRNQRRSLRDSEREVIQKEEARQESEKRFEIMANSAPVLVWMAGLDNRRNWFNKGWLGWTGRTVEQELGDTWASGMDGEDRARCVSVFTENFREKKEFYLEYRLRHSSGKYRWVRDHGVPRFTSSGTFEGYIGACMDIDDQKVAEAALVAAKEEAERANELKSAFLANMSHEIRTPLGAMLGFSNLLRDPGTSEAEKANYIEILNKNGEQLGRVINDILDLSKVETGHINFEYMRVRPLQIAHEVVSLMFVLAKEKGLSLSFSDDGSTPEEIVTDPTRMKQVLMNLVSNALKFTKVGTIKITLSGYEGKAGEKCCAFEVTDSGIGIPEESVSQLFKMFTQADNSMTRKYGGTGLGLALSRSLARAMGGDVRLVSTKKNHGSTFHFSIESREELLVAARNGRESVGRLEQVPIRENALENLKILLVEDSPDNQQLIWRYLSKYGAQVEIADNGLEGITKALVGEHDLILMDLQMPVMDGYTATGKLRGRGYDKPIIALTAHAMADVRKKCQDVGCTDHLPKPINQHDLIDMLVTYSQSSKQAAI